MLVFRNIHAGYGELLQLVPLVVVGLVLWRRGLPMQRVAPVLLDVNIALGLLLYLLTPIKVSIWHPVLMIVAAGLAHAVSRSQSRAVLVGAWLGVFTIVAVSVQIAAGRIAL